jgi:hypothetical protein
MQLMDSIAFILLCQHFFPDHQRKVAKAKDSKRNFEHVEVPSIAGLDHLGDDLYHHFDHGGVL